MTITSHQNHKLKEIRKLHQRRRWRERTGRFVAEGEDLLAAADAAGWTPVERYCAAGSGLAGVEVQAELLASVSGLGSGTRALAVYQERWAERPLGPVCVALWGVGDPGNVGTILRGALAFAAGSVALGPGCADPFAPKAVRASMGAVFAVPVARVQTPAELPGLKLALIAGAGLPLAEAIASVAEQGRPRPPAAGAPPADPVPPPPPADRAAPPDLTLLIGAERSGLPMGVAGQADLVAHIPIATDSLNAAVAAAIALYELRTRMARR